MSSIVNAVIFVAVALSFSQRLVLAQDARQASGGSTATTAAPSQARADIERYVYDDLKLPRTVKLDASFDAVVMDDYIKASLQTFTQVLAAEWAFDADIARTLYAERPDGGGFVSIEYSVSVIEAGDPVLYITVGEVSAADKRNGLVFKGSLGMRSATRRDADLATCRLSRKLDLRGGGDLVTEYVDGVDQAWQKWYEPGGRSLVQMTCVHDTSNAAQPAKYEVARLRQGEFGFSNTFQLVPISAQAANALVALPAPRQQIYQQIKAAGILLHPNSLPPSERAAPAANAVPAPDASPAANVAPAPNAAPAPTERTLPPLPAGQRFAEQTYVDRGADLVLRYPGEWQRIGKDNPAATFMIAAHSTTNAGGHETAQRMLWVDAGSHGMFPKLDKISQSRKQAMQRGASNYRVIDDKPTTIAGVRARCVDATYTFKAIPMKCREYHLLHSGNKVFIGISCPEAEFDEWVKIADPVVMSVQLK